MQKDFDGWNEEKKRVHANDTYVPFYHEREIRWCRLGVNIGFEQDGKGKECSRPVLILKGFSRHACLIVPLTTSIKQNPYHVWAYVSKDKNVWAIISQIRLIDARRLDKKIGIVNIRDFNRIRNAIKAML